MPSPPNQLPDNNAILLSISSNSKKTIFGVISPNFWLVMLQPGGHAAAPYQNSSNPAAGHLHMASSQAAVYMSANGAPPSVTAGVKHERLPPTSQYNRSNSESAALALQQHIHQRQQHSAAAAAAAAAQQAGMVSRENIFQN